MNLFEIPLNYFSHPNYSLIKHIKNISFSFNNNYHQQAAYFHDIGKLKKEFQNYIREPSTQKKTKHALESAAFYFAYKKYRINPEIFAIFFTILKHHGNLENVNEYVNTIISDEDKISYNYPNLDKTLQRISEIIGLKIDWDIEEFCGHFDDENFVINYNLQGLENYYLIKKTFSQLIFADKYEAIFKDYFQHISSIDAEKYINKLNHSLIKKKNKLAQVRNQARKEILRNFLKNKEKRIYIIEGPTGIGKTLTALNLALKIVNEKNKKRIITALPMTSIIDQTYIEYGKIFSDTDLLKFHHLTKSKNYINHNEEKENEKNQTLQRNEFLTMSWASDKIIITTFNQLFNCFFSNSNKDLIKFWTIENSVIILDEIQAIPRILLKDFSYTIEFLSKELNIDFILMSATIPAIKNFLDQNNTCELLDNKYFSMDFNNRYSLHVNLSINDENKLVKSIKNVAKSHKTILCVVNTKNLALRLFLRLRKIFGNEILYLLSANFIPIHRNNILDLIKNRLKNGEKTILISTQVIEAGVDLDFDIGFREFAPFSSIIQTAGRINREGRKKIAKLIITDQIGASPYHSKDISKKEVIRMLKYDVQEKDMLKILKQYFHIVIEKTTPDPLLIPKMKQLDFEDVAMIFSKNFMPSRLYLGSIFVEINNGLLDKFKEKRKIIFNNYTENNYDLESQQSLKIQLKNLHKELAKYIINVPLQDIKHFPLIWENSEIFYLPYNYVEEEKMYSMETGWRSNSDTYMW